MSGNNNITVAFPDQENWSVWWWNGVENFQLDIVGFLAVLGESAVLANAQVAALSRLFYLPRILPAPQALIRTARPTSLPHSDGKVTGVVSGNVKDHVHHVANILLATGPLTWVTLIGFMEALTLLIASIVFGDGMSLIATILLAGLSTLVGICNKWTLELPQPPKGKREIPKGDVVIRYPNGSFLVVKCNEHVARELYFAPEEIDYAIKSPVTYRLLSLIGTLMLMLGIVALANAKLYLQVAWAGAYIITNIAHWIAAALPQNTHWDLSCYDVREQGLSTGPENANFTEALWKAILLTQSIQWVRPGGAAPQTKVWDDWLEDALTKAKESAGKGEREAVGWEVFWPVEVVKGEVEAEYQVWKVPEWAAKAEWDRMNKETNAEPFTKA
ncbi:hypothetical protein M409DRAFT_64853 [Zasmidium cellare ATCC 36951]|uniref:Uncharacterized protein n=1 Tax=Zasmidium cellare ATCC 36951 TaxID=1080233 RepID=A0A6A6CRG4_ZASCE|nr:uncharacterized protein M409DRAFT_64853 [Zasmidium cellare ATCC 36951]KAF2169867.1 hypothetical protein M409DRAFT_64853 [Zasmidium cellare ATCC 36951]